MNDPFVWAVVVFGALAVSGVILAWRARRGAGGGFHAMQGEKLGQYFGDRTGSDHSSGVQEEDRTDPWKSSDR